MDDKTKEAVYLFHELIRIQRHKELLQQQLREAVVNLSSEEFTIYIKLTIDEYPEEEKTNE